MMPAKQNFGGWLAACDTGTVRTPWRRWRPGPKHGIAHGAAVFGPSGVGEPARLLELLGGCELLRAWAGSHGIVLDDEPGSLAALDGQIDAWRTEPDLDVIAQAERRVTSRHGTLMSIYTDAR